MPEPSGVVTAMIPLPLFYNPDVEGKRTPIEEEKFEQTAEEIAKRFGGGMLHLPPQVRLVGYWWDRMKVYKDDLALLEMDIPDSEEARDWLRNYARDVLLARFVQEAIYLRFMGPIQSIVVTEEKITRE